uniref:Uncharacterized protein n=2 Tax=Picea TaxID=3328 RepID=A0A101LXP2_PICGL|nr:hypothetical protein ABT39_MTgene5451 [Picea glauca]QHR91512.1 hypothetical protein Q903MT_gene5547 [Picea sitchensis]
MTWNQTVWCWLGFPGGLRKEVPAHFITQEYKAHYTFICWQRYEFELFAAFVPRSLEDFDDTACCGSRKLISLLERFLVRIQLGSRSNIELKTYSLAIYRR